jgi:N-methylhydantoinase B
VETIYRVGSDSTQVVTFGDGDIEPAFGVDGGKDGTLNKIELRYPDGRVAVLKSKDLIMDVPAGTVYRQLAGGGGGYGLPTERPVDRVRQETRDGIVSLASARDTYGVALDANFNVLADETARRRAAAGRFQQ